MNKSKKNKVLGASLAAIAAIGGTFVVRNKLKKIRKVNEIENNVYENGRVRKLGTLYLNTIKQNISLNSDEIINYEDGIIEIRDSEKNDDKISWIEINEGNKKLLICNRNLIKNISWNELNNQNLVYGKLIKLGEKKYILRLLTGAINEFGQEYSEWDRYILNAGEIEGIPVSTDDDKNNTIKEEAGDKSESESNSMWNWRNCCSFTQSEYGKNNKFCVIRGLYSTTYNNYCDKDISYDTVGYRPVLELLE